MITRFYVRAKGNPKLYWTTYTNGLIYASETSRTRFCIRIDGDDKNKIMIGSDAIIISSATDSKRHLAVRDNGELYLSSHSTPMRFRDFKNNFLAEANGDADAPVVNVDNAGEVWELVS